MSKLLNKLEAEAAQGYAEESAKPAIYAMLALLILVVVPFGYLIRQIGVEGAKNADTSRYTSIAGTVQEKIQNVKTVLQRVFTDDTLLAETKAIPLSVTLITPDIAPTNREEAVQNKNRKFDINLKFISWTPHNPLVNIDGETYREGDTVKGHEIIEIRKTEVVFKSPTGEQVIKYFYEYLGK